MNQVLILGAGLVVRPMARFLMENRIGVTIASRTLSKAEDIIGRHPLGKALAWTVENEKELEQMVRNHELVVSLLPYAHHVKVARYCLKYGKNMITTSYVSPEMLALDKDAKQKGILLLNEIGLDPGIDHMSAMRIIDKVHEKGGKIRSFFSLCGALPAPEAADNPFRYKFSWSPKGVIMAGNNTGKYLKKGSVIELPTEDLFKDTFRVLFPGPGELEVYPNRDSLLYKEIYGLQEAETVFRGTFRYPGWCESLDALKSLNLTRYESINLKGKTYASLLAQLMGEQATTHIRSQAATYLGLSGNAHALDAMEWLGLFSHTPIQRTEDSPFEVLSDLMIDRMTLGPKERDMVVMQHSFSVSYPDGTEELIRSRMLDYGTPETDTSVARTVSLPAAIAARLLLEKKIQLKGVFRPVVPDLYQPVLNELEKIHIRMEEEFGLPSSEGISW